jgi:hypothetical protein
VGNQNLTFSKRKNAPLIQESKIRFFIKNSKCDFCDFSFKYTGLPWIREAFFHFENVKFGFSACFYPQRVHFQKIFSHEWSPELCSISKIFKRVFRQMLMYLVEIQTILCSWVTAQGLPRLQYSHFLHELMVKLENYGPGTTRAGPLRPVVTGTGPHSHKTIIESC